MSRTDDQKWMVKFIVNGRQFFIGYFELEQDAIDACLTAKKKHVLNIY